MERILAFSRTARPLISLLIFSCVFRTVGEELHRFWRAKRSYMWLPLSCSSCCHLRELVIMSFVHHSRPIENNMSANNIPYHSLSINHERPVLSIYQGFDALLFCFYPSSIPLTLHSSSMSESATIAITTVLSILAIVAIVGNLLVCAIIKKNREMR